MTAVQSYSSPHLKPPMWNLKRSFPSNYEDDDDSKSGDSLRSYKYAHYDSTVVVTNNNNRAESPPQGTQQYSSSSQNKCNVNQLKPDNLNYNNYEKVGDFNSSLKSFCSSSNWGSVNNNNNEMEKIDGGGVNCGNFCVSDRDQCPYNGHTKSGCSKCQPEHVLARVLSKLRCSSQKSQNWIEKELSVKELRQIIPLFMVRVFDSKCIPSLKKVKGIWESPPSGWPRELPYCDPNNGNKEVGKPRKSMLTKTLTFLLEKYKEKYGFHGEENEIKCSSCTSYNRSSSQVTTSFSAPHSVHYSDRTNNNNTFQNGNLSRDEVTSSTSPRAVETSQNMDRTMPQLISVTELPEDARMQLLLSNKNDLDIPEKITQKYSSTSPNYLAENRQHEGHYRPTYSLNSNNNVSNIKTAHNMENNQQNVRQNDLNSWKARSEVSEAVYPPRSLSWDGISHKSHYSPVSPVERVNTKQRSISCSEAYFNGLPDNNQTLYKPQEQCGTKPTDFRKMSMSSSDSEVVKAERSNVYNKSHFQTEPKIEETHDNEDCSDNDPPIGRDPTWLIYYRMAEKVHFLHWKGWLDSNNKHLFYTVLDIFKRNWSSLKEENEETYLEEAHKFDLTLDVTILKKCVPAEHQKKWNKFLTFKYVQ